LDGKAADFQENDIHRRNTIAKLLGDWGLVNLITQVEDYAPLSQIKIIAFKEKGEWNLVPKYNIGKKVK
jgi:hypothetical protein